MNNIKSLIDGAKSISSDGWDSLKTIAQFLNYVMHPGLAIHALWNYTVAYAFWICLLICLLAAVFYALGFKKCAKWIPGSIAIFTLIKTIGGSF